MPVTFSKVPFSSPDPTHFVHLISNLLSDSECDDIIASHENLVPSNITPGTIRTREQFDDPALAALLWSRISHFYANDRIQDEDGIWWIPKCLNPHLRLSKYEKGGRFTAHYDYSRRTSCNEKSYMSVNIYLNTVPEEFGGATRVLRNEEGTGSYWNGRDELSVLAKVQPVKGSASIFRDTLWHDGEALWEGEKYLLRTDIMYQPDKEFDFDKVYADLEDVEKAEKASQLADELLDGGAVAEAEDWYKKAYELSPRPW